ncbi:MAG: bifunctional adenosylcobinamide kinase/adenosylcobinamide-phosphate guanylyltransferase [Candidatus Omnitrophica bacterium]|nr:bifunctional adenosylcobinamide kinase/adenosylcobinamide-phosphate guanylyltransferase [Candidatus Omnitrophota bacterium]MCM8803176.1 bifunctional adenosylcobinamide kinase/adenosylcobinamide-phosphate guanylyltransferase [Candidatus Omnitrophota bacterium]
MGKIIFITGPVRSGKSRFAVKIAKEKFKNVVFIATGKPIDDEMKERIKKHKESRPKEWKTIEEEIDIENFIKNGNAYIIDCLTTWITNLIVNGYKEKEIIRKVEKLIENIRKTNSSAIIISNEVGWGIVPENKLARDFRDIIGNIHQIIVEKSDIFYLIVAGVPLKLKGGEIE